MFKFQHTIQDRFLSVHSLKCVIHAFSLINVLLIVHLMQSNSNKTDNEITIIFGSIYSSRSRSRSRRCVPISHWFSSDIRYRSFLEKKYEKKRCVNALINKKLLLNYFKGVMYFNRTFVDAKTNENQNCPLFFWQLTYCRN